MCESPLSLTSFSSWLCIFWPPFSSPPLSSNHRNRIKIYEHQHVFLHFNKWVREHHITHTSWHLWDCQRTTWVNYFSAETKVLEFELRSLGLAEGSTTRWSQTAYSSSMWDNPAHSQWFSSRVDDPKLYQKAGWESRGEQVIQ